jgi:hypothetical protein
VATPGQRNNPITSRPKAAFCDNIDAGAYAVRLRTITLICTIPPSTSMASSNEPVGANSVTVSRWLVPRDDLMSILHATQGAHYKPRSNPLFEHIYLRYSPHNQLVLRPHTQLPLGRGNFLIPTVFFTREGSLHDTSQLQEFKLPCE